MTEASLSAKVTADIADFTKKFGDMRSSIDRLSKPQSIQIEQFDFGKMADGMASVGATLTKTLSAAAIPLAGLGGLATKTAIEFESSFAGVKKTIDATDEEFKQLELGIRSLAKEIPVPVNELNKIAETAGALGIAKDGIIGFTATIAAMAATTNLSADAAANSFARIGSIMGVTADDFSRLGSTVVDLGNKGASTETEIVEMALRLAGAARSAGIATPEMLGLSAALANVGIRAEAGGTAMSKLIMNLAGTVSAGGDKLQQFSAVAGLSADRFAEAFRSNAAGAIALFIQGLGNIQRSGGDLFGTLDELGIKEVRLRDAILRSASASEQFTQTLDIGRSAWQQNSALTEEAAKRYQTTASQIQLFQQKLTDVQITLGTAFLPMLVNVLQAAEPFIQMLSNTAAAFARLDPAMQTSIVALTGLAAVSGPVLLALAGLVRAAQTLIPVFTAMNAVIAANPYTALAAATIAVAALVIANWDTIKGAAQTTWAIVRDTITGAARAIYNGLIEWLVNKATAIATKVQSIAESVAKPFEWLADHLVGHSVIPDMIDEIGRQMQNLDVAMTAPARNATANTGKIFEGMSFTAESAMNQLVSTINFSWGSATQTVSNALAQMTSKHVEWAQVGIQIGQQFLGAMINQILQLMTQWALATVFGQTQNAAQLAAHTAAESAKTAVTATNESIRLGIMLATNKAILAGVIATLGSIAAVGTAASSVLAAIVVAVSSTLAAIGAALVATIVGAELGAAFLAASAVVLAAGIPAALAAAGAIQTAVGTAIVAATSALAVPAFASGGAVFGPTLALVGEHATRSNPEYIGHANQLGLSQGGGQQTIVIELDGRVLAKATLPWMPGVIYLHAGARG